MASLSPQEVSGVWMAFHLRGDRDVPLFYNSQSLVRRLAKFDLLHDEEDGAWALMA